MSSALSTRTTTPTVSLTELQKAGDPRLSEGSPFNNVILCPRSVITSSYFQYYVKAYVAVTEDLYERRAISIATVTQCVAMMNVPKESGAFYANNNYCVLSFHISCVRKPKREIFIPDCDAVHNFNFHFKKKTLHRLFRRLTQRCLLLLYITCSAPNNF